MVYNLRLLDKVGKIYPGLTGNIELPLHRTSERTGKEDAEKRKAEV